MGGGSLQWVLEHRLTVWLITASTLVLIIYLYVIVPSG